MGEYFKKKKTRKKHRVSISSQCMENFFHQQKFILTLKDKWVMYTSYELFIYVMTFGIYSDWDVWGILLS